MLRFNEIKDSYAKYDFHIKPKGTTLDGADVVYCPVNGGVIAYGYPDNRFKKGVRWEVSEFFTMPTKEEFQHAVKQRDANTRYERAWHSAWHHHRNTTSASRRQCEDYAHANWELYAKKDA